MRHSVLRQQQWKPNAAWSILLSNASFPGYAVQLVRDGKETWTNTRRARQARSGSLPGPPLGAVFFQWTVRTHSARSQNCLSSSDTGPDGNRNIQRQLDFRKSLNVQPYCFLLSPCGGSKGKHWFPKSYHRLFLRVLTETDLQRTVQNFPVSSSEMWERQG